MNNLLWLMRREIWENRSFFIVPLVVGALLVVGVGFNLYWWDTFDTGITITMDGVSGMDGLTLDSIMQVGFVALAIPFNIALALLVFFYLQDALYSDRKDRSILFWKSLPVSDTATVLAKFATASVLLPLIIVAATVVTVLALAIIETPYIWLKGGSAWNMLWKPLPLFSGSVFITYGFMAQALWYAPLTAWLLLMSSWARRAPILWALAPPLLVMLAESMFFHTNHAAIFLHERLIGVFPLAFTDENVQHLRSGMGGPPDSASLPENLMAVTDVTSLLSSPGLWGGLVAAAVFLTGAIWLRRYRDESL